MTADLLAHVPIEPLTRWLTDHAGAVAPLTVTHLSGGSSNLTYRVRDVAGHDWVLRRPPAGSVPTGANDMGREYRVQQALRSTDVPVPHMVSICDDPTVIGATFYVMERLDGIAYNDAAAVAHLSPAEASAATDELIDVLARLHAVDPAGVGLAGLGRPAGFLARQVRRWTEQWQHVARPLPVVDEVAARLSAELPDGDGASIVHGDYSFNNTMWHRDRPAVMQAVLDWEMATLGDPLTDLGMVVAYWGPVGELLWRERAPQPHRLNPGFPDADALVARYAAASGRSVDRLGFYVALATFKLAVITAGAIARREATDPEAARRTQSLAEELAVLARDALA